MIILCSDLDRTLIPNGDQPESPAARPLFRGLCETGLIRLAYVSGRHKELVMQAIEDFDLPHPDYIIGDVGTTLYRTENGKWTLDQAWQDKIGADWSGYSNGDIVELLNSIDEPKLELQPDAKQNKYKVSYFTDAGECGSDYADLISRTLDKKGIRANLIWSIDEAEDKGLLDILPASANKVSAIRFLVEQENFSAENTVFAGDSGNDMDALTSGLQAILVNNAAPEIRREALQTVKKKGIENKLYLAHGKNYFLNGNYVGGVLEGLSYFFSKLDDWILKELDRLPKNDYES
jgi:sucrose-6F-phosphate phosphohydrolase